MLVRARFVIYLFGCMQVNGMTATRLHTCVLIIFGILHSLALSGWPSTSPQSSYIHKSVKKEIKNLLHLLKRCTARKMYFMFDNIQVIQMKHVRLWMIGQVVGCMPLYLRLTLVAIPQGGIFIVPHVLECRASVFALSFKGPPAPFALYDKQGTLRTYLPYFY
mgnify:CR=1 FL=1